MAELAEATLARLARVIGGGAFSRRSPFAHWYEDVRALGFLRPPWGLAYDNLLRAVVRPARVGIDLTKPPVMAQVRHVDVFERDGKLHLPGLDFRSDFIESTANLGRFGGREKPDLGKHAGVGLATNNIVTVESAVETNRFGERFDAGIGPALKPPAPRLLSHCRPRFAVRLRAVAIRVVGFPDSR